MNKIFCALLLGVTGWLTACDEIAEGDRYLEMPAVESRRAVLLEEFTGQMCTNCPEAQRRISSMKEQYGDQLVVVGIHAGNFGLAESDYGSLGLMQPEGDEYATRWNIESYPAGVIDRTSGVLNAPDWAAYVRNEVTKEAKLGIGLSAVVTENEEGDKPVWYESDEETGEALYAARIIAELRREGYKLSDFAVLMRINALTRSYEQEFTKYGISYKVFGGFRFFERKEIKDALAYLRLIANPFDSEAVSRIINVPRRGIGEKTMEALRAYAEQEELSLYDAVLDCDLLPLGEAVKSKLRAFGKYIKDLVILAQEAPVNELCNTLMETSGMKEMYLDGTDEGAAKRANLDEFLNSVEEFVHLNPEATLSDYLQQITLYSDTDEMDEDDYVTIATIHAVKGLEFRCVFLCGLEENIMPTSRAQDDPAALEEERRLMYVAITRAVRTCSFVLDGEDGLPECLGRSGQYIAIEKKGKDGEDEISIRKIVSFADMLMASTIRKDGSKGFPLPEGRLLTTSEAYLPSGPENEDSVTIVLEPLEGVDMAKRGLPKARPSKPLGDAPDSRNLLFGTKIHRALEVSDIKAGIPSPYLPKGDGDSFDLVEAVKRVLDSPLMREIREFDKVLKEYPYIDEEDGSSGRMDLVAIRGDEAIIVDYKTYSIDDPLYDGQLNAYREHLRIAFPELKEVRCYLLSLLDPRKVREVKEEVPSGGEAA